MKESKTQPKRPLPDLTRRRITMDEYMALTPEKLELWQGYLIDPPKYTRERRNLLSLLLVNEGLLQAVKMAPAERWREALRQVYGEP